MSFQLTAEPPKPKAPPKQKREKQDNSAEAKRLAKVAAFWAHIPPPADPLETSFRHSHWAAKRAKVRAALQAAAGNVFLLDRFDQCGGDAVLEWSPSAKKYRIRASYCHCRHCEPCMRAKANVIAANLQERLKQATSGRYRFLTLTLKHTDQPLAEQIKRLYASFRTLRKTKLWNKTQRGGASMLEVKWDPKTRKWHPHLHVVTEGDFIKQTELSTAWLAATGDSKIVDIRKLDKAKDAAFYVAKYVTKGTSSEVWNDPDAAAEWITASKGVRTCATFGTWRGYRLTQNKSRWIDWKPVSKLKDMIRRMQAGDEAALRVILSLDPRDRIEMDKGGMRYAPPD